MRTHSFKSCAGFTFIAAMIMVVIMGIMLGAVGQTWRMVMIRDKEAELLFRGGQYLDAIEHWNKGASNITTPGKSPSPLTATPIKDLKDLLEDPRSLQKVHHIRKLYLDPMTNKEFDPIKGTGGGIIGVASTSKEKPVKVDFQNMTGVYKTFANKQKYSDWKFVPTALQGQIAPDTTVTGLPGSPGLPPGQPPPPIPRSMP